MANRRTTNSRRQSHKRRQKAMTDALKLILALMLIAAAVIVVVFVKNELGSGLGFWRGTDESSESESTEESESAVTETEEEGPGFNRDPEGRLYYLDEEGERLSDSWMAEGDELYYIDEEGYVCTEDMTDGGMRFGFSEDGAVTSIVYDDSYRPADKDDTEEGFSLVSDRRVRVFLDPEQKSGSFYLIRYRRTTDDTAYDLGGGNRQYTSPYSMQIDGDYVYFLPLTDQEEPEDSYTNGNLYRMELGAEVRDLIAEDVEGYKVLDGMVYYQSGGVLRHTDRAGKDTTVPDFSEVEDFSLDISSGDKAYLYTADGRPVAQASDEFKAGNFRYELASDGEILSVAEKSTVNTGGYTYSIEGDDAFGSPISRVVRTSDETGKKEIISSEFDGSCGNLHYDFDSGSMLAEYTDTSGKSRILKITKDGDVDYLIDDGGGDGKLVLYGIQDHEAICRKTVADGEISFVSLRIRASVPMALAVEPMEIGDDPNEGEVIDIGGTTAAQSTEELENVSAPSMDKDTETIGQGPGVGLVGPQSPSGGHTAPGDQSGPGSAVVTAPPG